MSPVAAAAAAAVRVTHVSCPPPYLAESAVRSHVALAALVTKAKLYAAARKNRFARSIDAPVTFLDLGGGRCGGALRAVETLEVGTDPAAYYRRHRGGAGRRYGGFAFFKLQRRLCVRRLRLPHSEHMLSGGNESCVVQPRTHHHARLTTRTD